MPVRASVDDFGSLDGEETEGIYLAPPLRGRDAPLRLSLAASERTVFLELMKVEGIGPKQALRVLSGIRPEALDAALEGDDLAALQRIPGVGPKMAQKMLLALKGKLVLHPEELDSRQAELRPCEWADLVARPRRHGLRPQARREDGQGDGARRSAGPERERELFRRALLELSAGA